MGCEELWEVREHRKRDTVCTTVRNREKLWGRCQGLWRSVRKGKCNC